MSTSITTPPNSIWPNGLKVNEEKHNTFYSLGIIKEPIPDGIHTFWPDGDTLIGNIVYKDGLISGFVDTKALMPNDSRQTTIPYDYVDITLGSILEGQMTINKEEGKEYADLKIKYATDLPYGFTKLDYIETSGTQYIKTGVEMTNDTKIEGKARSTYDLLSSDIKGVNTLFGIMENTIDYNALYLSQQTVTSVTVGIGNWDSATEKVTNTERHYNISNGTLLEFLTDGIRSVTVNDVLMTGHRNTTWITSGMEIPIFRRNQSSMYGEGEYELYSFSITNGDEKQREFIPVLDTKKRPCLYDKVTGQCFYNEGTGVFGYRITSTGETAEPKSSTYSLRDPYYVAPSGIYAKLIGENQLDIIADTDIEKDKEQSYTWFASVSEANEYFGIIIPEELN